MGQRVIQWRVPGRWTVTRLSIFVAALIALPSLSIDVVMPGFAAMRSETGASLLDSGLVITLFMLGLALGQACLGPLSDRLGRRPVLLGGLTLYVVASLGCALAASASQLLSFRSLQGLGAGAGTVLALAIIRDLLEGDGARVVRSYAVAVFNVVPIIAPSLGAMLLTAFGWRSAYTVPAALGAGLLGWVMLGFGETHPDRQRESVRDEYAKVDFMGRHFVGYVTLNAASYAALMAYIAGSSLVIMEGMGLSPQAYALAFAATSVALMVGAAANGRLAGHGFRGATLLAIGLAVGAVCSLGLAILSIDSRPAFWLLTVLAVASRGLTGPNAQQAALDPIRNPAGTAAGLLSLMQVLAGAAASAAIIPLYRMLGPQGVQIEIAGCMGIALVAWAVVRRSKPAHSYEMLERQLQPSAAER